MAVHFVCRSRDVTSAWMDVQTYYHFRCHDVLTTTRNESGHDFVNSFIDYSMSIPLGPMAHYHILMHV